MKVLLGASRGRLCDSKAFLLEVECCIADRLPVVIGKRFSENCCQPGGGGWNLQFSRCCVCVGFGNKVDIVVHYDNIARSGFLSTPIRMTVNYGYPECPIHLKARFSDDTPDVRMLWFSELTMRDWTNTGLNCQRLKCGQLFVVSEHMTIEVGTNFRTGLLHKRRRKTGIVPLKLVFSIFT